MIFFFLSTIPLALWYDLCYMTIVLYSLVEEVILVFLIANSKEI